MPIDTKYALKQGRLTTEIKAEFYDLSTDFYNPGHKKRKKNFKNDVSKEKNNMDTNIFKKHSPSETLKSHKNPKLEGCRE